MKLSLTLALISLVIVAYARIVRAEAPVSPGADAIALINKALADAKRRAADDQLATLQAAARAVLEARPANFLISNNLRPLLSPSELNLKQQVESLQTALTESAAVLKFRMKKEADLPRGFPESAALGEIQLTGISQMDRSGTVPDTVWSVF